MAASGVCRGFLLLSLATAWPASATTYKWVDEKGITHYGDTIPPQYVNQGVTEMDKKGLVIRKTEPALTPEQLRAQQAALVKQKELDKQTDEQRRHDLALLGTYTSEKDIDIARDRNTQQIDVTIRSAKERYGNKQARLKELATQMEFYQGKDKSGKPRKPPPEIVQELDEATRQQAVFNATILELEKQKQEVAARFDADKARFVEIKQSGVGSASATGTGTSKAERTTVAFAITPSSKLVIDECIRRWVGVTPSANSAYAVSAEASQTPEQVELILDGRVQTRTGQFNAQRMVCPLTNDGKIDSQGTEIKKALASLGARY